MVGQAAVVQIHRAHRPADVVADEAFGMDKAGGVLINFHTGLDEGAVVTLCQGERQAFVGDAGQDDGHIHAPTGSKAQSILQFMTEDQIGGHDVDVLLGGIENVGVDPFAYRLVVQRTVTVGNHIALGMTLPGRGCRQEGLESQGALFHLPHLQEH